jgi:hypothetical protein
VTFEKMIADAQGIIAVRPRFPASMVAKNFVSTTRDYRFRALRSSFQAKKFPDRAGIAALCR